MQKVAAIFLVLVCLTELAEAQWSYLGLSNTQVTNLTICYDTIYASTYDGIYKKNVLSTDTFWLACGMQGRRVGQTLVPDYQIFICLVEIDSSSRMQIFKSTNSGNTFSLMDTSVSGGSTYNFLNKMSHPEGNYDTLYFLGHQLKTFDGGVTWIPLKDVAWGHFIKVNPRNHAQIIVGGEEVVQTAKLQVSSDYGSTWTFPNMNGYFEGDNAIHDIVIDGNDWFGVGEGVICKTSDGGNNWNQLLNFYSHDQWALYIFKIVFSPVDKDKLYATGDNYRTYKVPLLYSSDRGLTWDTLSYTTFKTPRIRSLAVTNKGGGDKVFLGGQGVYSYENNFMGVHDVSVIHKYYYLSQNYPNPFNPSTTIEFFLPKKDHVTLTIHDMLGRHVLTLINQDIFSGTSKVRWEAQGYASGIYYYRIVTGGYSKTERLLLIK